MSERDIEDQWRGASEPAMGRPVEKKKTKGRPAPTTTTRQGGPETKTTQRDAPGLNMGLTGRSVSQYSYRGHTARTEVRRTTPPKADDRAGPGIA